MTELLAFKNWHLKRNTLYIGGFSLEYMYKDEF